MTHLEPDRILDLVLDLLPADEAAAAREHAAACEACAAALAAAEAEQAVLGEALAGGPAPAVADRVAGQVVSAVRAAATPAPVRAFRWRRWAAIAAGLAIVATLAVQLRAPRAEDEVQQAKQVLIDRVRVSELKALEEEEAE